MISLPDLKDWLPFRIDWKTSGPQVDWCRFGAEGLTEPFFEDSVARVMRKPFNVLFRHQTSMETLDSWVHISPGIPPSGFVFHMSRCGSTLVCQMLAALDTAVVISEAPPIDEVLRIAKLKGVSEQQRIHWVRGVISALGQPRAGGETRFFVKFDNWHALDLALVRSAFPEVPWIFVFRDPVEVMVSIKNSPAPHSYPGMMKLGVPELDQAQAGLVKMEDHCSNVLSHLCRAALDQLNDSRAGGIAVNYTELPHAVCIRIANHFRIEFTPAEIETMMAKTTRHAKSPVGDFQADSQAKQETATSEVREAAMRVMPLYEKLCAMAGTPHMVGAFSV